MKLNIKNEYDNLKTVLLSPTEEQYQKEQQQLQHILTKYNIQILYTKNNNNKYQMFTRDPFIVINNKILINNMAEQIRKKETATISDILNYLPQSNIIYVPKDIIIEGGDVIIHKNIIFVGQNGHRTNKKGLAFIKEHFKDKYQVIPLYLNNPDDSIPFIHLDCLFNPIANDTAIIYKEGFSPNSFNEIQKIFPKLIYINLQEQKELAANVLSLGNKTIILQKRHQRLINELKLQGFNIEEMDEYSTVDETGYTRCLTCPLVRTNK